MRHLKPNTVRSIIRLADRVPKEEHRQPGPPALAYPPPDEEVELYRAIERLGDAEAAELIALAWLGRGDHDETATDFPGLVEEAKSHSTNAAGYLTEKAPLPLYLRDGLLKLYAYAD
jgi:hypothetical protein